MDIPSNNAVEVKQVLLTISSNAESIGSFKESRLTPVEIHERLDGGLGGSRWALFGFCFMEWVCVIKVPMQCGNGSCSLDGVRDW